MLFSFLPFAAYLLADRKYTDESYFKQTIDDIGTVASRITASVLTIVSLFIFLDIYLVFHYTVLLCRCAIYLLGRIGSNFSLQSDSEANEANVDLLYHALNSSDHG